MKRLLNSIYLIGVLCYSCSVNTSTTQSEETATVNATAPDSTASAPALSYTNPVLPGDFADPSVTKVGDTYWATATSSEWAPLFPLLKSKDLINWELVGHVYPDKLPGWADAHFWAPEISYENGKTYIYYTANKKGGNLCVGVASATNPEGPYTDHGPLICQEAGSIDGFPVRDVDGQLYLVWKEDGNSVKKPTPIWGQRMNEERTALTGEKFELFRNDATWEGNLVEGPAIIRKGDYFYLFYAGDACCGKGCTYATGVARAKTITGPWEKNPANPILTKNETWKCPGHGTVITGPADKDYFLYHAYNTESFVYAGRQGLLDEIIWGTDGWPTFRQQSPHRSASAASSKNNLTEKMALADEFAADTLIPYWQWPVNNFPKYSLEDAKGGQLTLTAKPDKIGALLAQRTLLADYSASTEIDLATVKAGTWAGLAAIGDMENAIGISTDKNKIRLWQVKANKLTTIGEADIPKSGAQSIQFRLTAKDGDQFQFSWSADGQNWNNLNKDTSQFIDGAYLPPWDRAVRVGVVAKGSPQSAIKFNWFRLSDQAI